jgi:hypothetical protein
VGSTGTWAIRYSTYKQNSGAEALDRELWFESKSIQPSEDLESKASGHPFPAIPFKCQNVTDVPHDPHGLFL